MAPITTEWHQLPLLNGTNYHHFDVSTPDAQTSYAEAARIGQGYAGTVLAALNGLSDIPAPVLRARNRMMTVESRKVSAADLEEARRISAKYSDLDGKNAVGDLTAEDLARKNPVALKFFADAALAQARNHDLHAFNLVCIDFGPVCVVSLPSEVFVEIGMTIRREIFPEKMVLIATHSGTGALRCTGGYIPNFFNYGHGGYETSYEANPFESDTANKLIDNVRRLKMHIAQ